MIDSDNLRIDALEYARVFAYLLQSNIYKEEQETEKLTNIEGSF